MARGRKQIDLPKENGISFASFYCVLKDAWNGKVSDCELINLLFGFVTTPAGVVNQNGDPFYIDSGNASKIKNGKMDIQRTIRKAREDCRVLSTIEDSFAKMVLPSLNSSKIEQLQCNVLSLIRDSACSSDMKGKMADLAETGRSPSSWPMPSLNPSHGRTVRLRAFLSAKLSLLARTDLCADPPSRLI